MDAAQKAVLEKRIIAGLMGVFVIALVAGPARGLGWLKPRPKTAPLVEPVKLSKPLGTVMHDLWHRWDAEFSSQPPAAPAEPKPAAAYTAGNLRDPLKSLLPEPPPKPSVAAALQGAAKGGGQAPGVPKPVPPPTLHVEGLVWGGPTPAAIIDGEVYRVDDVVKGVKIVSIDRLGVTIDHDGTPVFYPPVASSLENGFGAGSRSARSQQRR